MFLNCGRNPMRKHGQNMWNAAKLPTAPLCHLILISGWSKSSNSASIYQEEEKCGIPFHYLHVCWMLPLTLMLPTKSILTGAKTVGPSLSEEKKSSFRCWVFSISNVYICSERAPTAGQAGNGPTVTAKEQAMASCKSLPTGWLESDPRLHLQNFTLTIPLFIPNHQTIYNVCNKTCTIPQPTEQVKTQRLDQKWKRCAGWKKERKLYKR